MLYSYNVYKDKVMEILQDKLGTENVCLTSVPKNNGVVLEGVQLNMGNNMASPILYFNESQEVFDDADVERFVEEAVRFFNSEETFPTDAVMNFRDWSIAKDNLRAKVINYEANKEYLADKPFVRFLDLAVAFQVSTEGILPRGEEGVITVNNSILKCWGVDTDTLYMEAMKNLEQTDYRICGIGTMMGFGTDGDEESLEDEMLCVATTYEGHGGAAVILSPVVLNEACKKMRSKKVYILPSSIHELLLIDCEKADVSHLRTMVADVNASVLDAQDRLSDTVYIFENGMVKVA